MDDPVYKNVPLSKALLPDMGNPLLPNQFVPNAGFNLSKAVKLVLYSYTFTSNDISTGYVNLTVPHSLSFKPFVQASFSNSVDNLFRQLPYFWQSPLQSYYQASAPGGTDHVASYSVQIFSVDDTNISVSIKMFDILGISSIISSAVFNFKFYCSQFTLD